MSSLFRDEGRRHAEMKLLAGAHTGRVGWKPGSSSRSPAEGRCTQGNGSIRPSHVSWTLGGGGGGGFDKSAQNRCSGARSLSY